jgi:hypothetical protein
MENSAPQHWIQANKKYTTKDKKKSHGSADSELNDLY